MQNHTRPTPLERFLGMFTDIRAGEGPTGLTLFANVFLILCAYYFVKPLRDSWIAVSPIEGLSKMEVKAYSSFAQSLLLAGVSSLFAYLSATVARRRLITGSTMFVMSNLVVFWLLRPGFLFENLAWAGVAFYLWVGMFGVFIVAQFWTMAADLYAGERGTRLLPLIAIGATGGAAFGSWLTGRLLDLGLGQGELLLVTILPLAVSILLTHIADKRGPLGKGPVPERKTSTTTPAARPRGGRGAIAFLLSHPYLVTVAMVVMLANWVNTNGENLLFRVIQDSLSSEAARQGLSGDALSEFTGRETARFYSDMFLWVNVIALVVQAFFASRLLRYGGFGAIMLMLPSIAFVSYSTMALLPVLAVVRVLKIAENATDYSINNTARQVLWLPTTSEMKYRAKPAIDSLFVRLGDGFAALTVLVGSRFLDLSTQRFFVFNVLLVVLWLAASTVIVRMYSRMMADAEPGGAEGAPAAGPATAVAGAGKAGARSVA